MSFMPWTEELLTGISQVDEQHKWLVDATNELYEELSKSQPDGEAVSEILFGLIDYTFNHFIMEEDLFQRLGYPEADAHKKQHNAFTDNLTTLLQQHDAGEPVTTETIELLRNWLINHIMKTDKAYVSFFREHGIT